MTEPPRLLQFRVSHYNEKVRWALDYKRWGHRREDLLPGFHIPRTRRLTGQNQVPILVIEGKALAGSNHILEEIERRRPEPPLYPEEPAERARALELQRYFDDEVAPDLRRLFWACYLERSEACARMATDGFSNRTRLVYRALLPVMRPVFVWNMGLDRARVRRAHERLHEYFDRLESEIGPSGYLVGDRFGVADLCAAAVMSPIIRPPEFPYPLPEPWPDELLELRASIAKRQGFRWVLETYSRHRGSSSEERAP